jgi:hypothetical protein
MKKTLYTLAIDDYAPEICALTFPLMRRWADKIGAHFQVIKERKFPDYPVTYEKLQIYQLGQEAGNDWCIFLDADAVIHPDTLDITEHLPKDSVLHNAVDVASNRWTYDRFFRRDGRHIGSCNWFTIASDWCIDLWKPIDDLTLAQTLDNIHVIQLEAQAGITRDHLIDDYTLSRNIARFGLKVMTFNDIRKKVGQEQVGYLWHQYMISNEEKLNRMTELLSTPVGKKLKSQEGYGWGLMKKQIQISQGEIA